MTSLPRYDQFPEELRSKLIWVVWRFEKRAKKDGTVYETKVPYNARSRKHAKVNDPTTWSSFDQAVVAFEDGGYDGIGICLIKPYVGADLDGCRDQNGVIEPWADQIIHELDSYTEITVSDYGIRVLATGELPDGGRQKDFKDREHHGLGLYDAARGRFLAMTGMCLNGNGMIAERTAELQRIHARWFPPKAKPKSEPQASAGPSDDDLIKRAQRANDGGKFSRLWDGQWEGDYGSQSEADLALCMKLAFWTDPRCRPH